MNYATNNMFDKLQRLIKFREFLWNRGLLELLTINGWKRNFSVWKEAILVNVEIHGQNQEISNIFKNIDFSSLSTHHWYKIPFNPHLECTLSFKCCKSGKHSITCHSRRFHSRAFSRHFGICVGESMEKANTETVSDRLSHPSFLFVTSSLHIEKKISAKRELLQHVTVNNLHFQHIFLV